MREIRTYGLMRGCWPVRLHGGLGSTPPRPRNWAANPLLGEPLDGAGNLGSGCVGDMRQLRELPRISALRLGSRLTPTRAARKGSPPQRVCGPLS
jgi:hypothetical protein